MIKIKCDYLNGAVAVPTEIIDKHLKLAPAASFKVLLFILRNPQGTADAKQISMCTGLSEEDVKNCIYFGEFYLKDAYAVELTEDFDIEGFKEENEEINLKFINLYEVFDINEEIYKEFPKNGLNAPIPKMDVTVKNA